jgi:hypothetical protein
VPVKFACPGLIPMNNGKRWKCSFNLGDRKQPGLAQLYILSVPRK